MKRTRVPDLVECEHLSTHVSYTKTLTRTTSMQTSFPQRVSDSLCGTSVVMQTHCCSSCLSGCSHAILEAKLLDVEVLGWWRWMHGQIL